MDNIIIKCKQNIEDQYFDKFGLPMILCNFHQNSVCEFINLNSQNHNKLICGQCIIKDRIYPEFLISVKDIFFKKSKQYNLKLATNLMTNDVQESKKSQSIDQVDNYFDKLKVKILKMIDEHHKKILVHLNSIEENRQRVIDVYNQISNKDEIKDEFLKNINNQQQLDQYLKQIISNLQTSSQNNQSTINNTINEFTKYQKQYKYDYIQQVFKKYLNDLKSIDIFNNALIGEQQESSLVLKKKKEYQDEENNLRLKAGQIVENNERNQQKNDIKEIDLLKQLQIIKSNYGSYDNISLKKIENNYFLIDQKGLNWSQVIIDEELIREQKYQIQIDIQKNTYNTIMVGLLPISQKANKGWESKLSLYLYTSGFGIDLIESGKRISQLGKGSVKQISFQICLKEQILSCLCVANNEKNINSLDDWNKISPNQKYYFYIALGGKYKVEINQFKIIQQFDKW